MPNIALFTAVLLSAILCVGCSSSSKTIASIITTKGDVLLIGKTEANWFAEFPSTDYYVIDNKNFEQVLGPQEGTAVIRNKHRKLSITFSIKQANGSKSAVQCRDSHLSKPSMFTEPNSARTYEKDSVAFLEFNLNPVTGYSARYIEAFYLLDGLEFSVLVYISAFNELKDLSASDEIFKSIKIIHRSTQLNQSGAP